ncbi:Spt4-domain-containing protein [Didymella exigua CBS 183.55]|uniref:Transcription elongation factor SPT4 n=1 Tax=Didymella exigua CBS 183.55 TaxID=1150837 RepID=A0A6A5REH0_9PLEO|nr:Spt4-domain-containing protein [Didymella exigua CBS 183.55]KAF1926655.1 Spt4-domain-containing protein [Didymella exigua CBS 183.55]
MPPKKGLATTRKVDRYIYIDEDAGPPAATVKSVHVAKARNPLEDRSTPAKQHSRSCSLLANCDEENIDPNDFRGVPKRSNSIEPCQATESSHSVGLQQSTLANNLFPPKNQEHALPRFETVGSNIPLRPLRRLQRSDTPLQDTPNPNPLHNHNAPAEQQPAPPPKTRRLKSRTKRLDSTASESSQHPHVSSDPPIYKPSAKMTTMIPGGAFVPPNQQRNLRACMVCSIVRTYTQFMSGGCPNCEEILELAGNSENVNDCTSQVFEGLITVADTSKSWVARYQRLEGYVAGVYATQVEGILPDEMISAIEAAGINYVPRDGSEDQMIPKD